MDDLNIKKSDSTDPAPPSATTSTEEAASPRIDQELLKKKAEILKLRDDLKKYGNKGKRDFEKGWYKNILFFIGNQWISYDKAGRKWVALDVEAWYPKPITNKVAVVTNTIKSLLIQEDPRTIVKPESDSEKDIAVSEIGDSLVDVLNAESEAKMANEIGATWVVLTGNTFFHNYYYASKELGEIFIPAYQCDNAACKDILDPDQLKDQTCPTCKNGNMMQAMGPQGQQVGTFMPKGKIKEEAFSSFEIFFNQEIEDFDKVQQLVRTKCVSVDQAKDMFPKIKAKIEAQKSTGDGVGETYQKNLFYASNSGDNKGIYQSGQSVIENTHIDYLFSKETRDFPDGVMATIIDNEIVELSELVPQEYADGEPVRRFIPIVHCGNIRVANRFWHKTFIDDIITLQVQRNKLESFIWLQLYRGGAGKWLSPSGCNMDQVSGDPEQVLKYDLNALGGKPEHVAGIPPPPICEKLIEMIDHQIEDLGASYDVLKGQFPKGVDTYSGLRLLTERAFSRHNEMLRNWERCSEKRTKMKLELARQFWTEKRKHTFENKNGSWETREFDKADLQGGVTIQVEPGSTTPKSEAVQNAAIVDSVKLGLIHPEDPTVNYKILEKLGQSDLASSVGEDIKDARREWNEFVESVTLSPMDKNKWVTRPRLGIDNEMVHYNDAIAHAKTPEFFALSPKAQQFWVEHAQTHKMNLMAEQAQAQAAQAQPKGGSAPVSGAASKPPMPSPMTVSQNREASPAAAQ